MDALLTGLGMGGALLFLVLFSVSMARRFMHICEPNQVLVFSGRQRQSADGRKVGYRTVFSGLAFRMPIVERVDKMSLALMAVPVAVRGAYSKGGIPLHINAIANVKVHGNPRFIGNAIERFLHQTPGQIAQVAKETLEGHLRGVIATMTPEQVNEDRLAFAERLAQEASSDMNKLGLQLDVLKIQAVGDERNYLDSIGRARIAEIVRDAEIAESDAVRSAEEAEADSRARGGVAQQNAGARVQREENRLRQIRAELWSKVKSEQARASQAAAEARAQAEVELQELRSTKERLRLKAEVEAPAQALREAASLKAEGQAAAIAEQGRAISSALESIGSAWDQCGERAMDMIVVQHLDEIVDRVTSAAAAAQPKKASLLDSGDGSSIANYVSAYPATVGSLLEQLHQTLGVDVKRVLHGRTAKETIRPSVAVPDSTTPQGEAA